MRINRHVVILCALLLCALVLRIVFCYGLVGLHSPLRGDEEDYHRHASNIAAGLGFISRTGEPVAARPPLYPLALGGVYRIFGANEVVGRWFQIVLGVGVVVLTYVLGRMLFSPGVALMAAAGAAFSPALVFISAYILTENLYTVLLLIAVIFLTRILRLGRSTYGKIFLSGILLGLCSLARPEGFVFAVFAVLAAVFMIPGRLRMRIAKAAIVFLAVAATILPWTLRNHARLHAWVVFTTHGGITFYQSNCRVVYDVPFYYGAVAPRADLPHWDEIRAAGDVAGDRLAWKLGMDFLRKNPRLVPRLLARKFLRFWRASPGPGAAWWFSQDTRLGRLASRIDVGFVYLAVAVPLLIAGLIVTRRRARDLLLLYGVIVVHILVALVFHGSARARVPIEPAVAIFAAAGLAAVLGWIRRAVKGPQVVS